MGKHRNQKISQALDVPTYHYDQLLVTAAVQFCELGEKSFIDNIEKKQTNQTSVFGKQRKERQHKHFALRKHKNRPKWLKLDEEESLSMNIILLVTQDS